MFLNNIHFKAIFNSIYNSIYNFKEYNYLKRLVQAIKRKDIINKIFVFNVVRDFRRDIDNQLYLAIILALNGAKVKVLLDDGVLAHWDVVQIDMLPNIKKLKKYNYNPMHFFNIYENPFSKLFFTHLINKLIRVKAIQTYKKLNLDIIYYSNILNRNRININNWQELKKHAESSTIRFFKNMDLDFNDEYVKFYYNLSLKNAILSRAVGEYVLNNLKPDVFIVSSGIYSTWGPSYEFLKGHGIKCLSYSGIFVHAVDLKTITFTDATWQTLSRSKLWEKYKNNPVTTEMENKIKQYFDSRLKGISVDMKLIKYMEKEKLFGINKKDGYKYHIALFPNVAWDGNVRDRNIAFEGLLDWLISTINYVKNRKDIKLYIKAHPGEKHHCKTTPRILDLLEKYIKIESIENLVFIPPDSNINTYEFIKGGIDLGIVYDGIIGLEMPYLKVPTITCCKGGFSSVENGNLTVSTKKEYINYLDNIETVINEFHKNYESIKKNIIRYIYWYIFEDIMTFPIINEKFEYNWFLLKKSDLILDKKILKSFD